MSFPNRIGALFFLALSALAPTAPARAGAAGDTLDAAAARRRLEILRSPYSRAAERRALRGGELLVSFDAGVPAALRDDLSRDLAAFVAALVDRDGWPKPLSSRSPLLVLFTSGPGVTGSGWDGREADGALRSPVVAVAAVREGGPALFDAARQVALLSARQAAPVEPSWAVEGVATWLSRRALGSDSTPPARDPFLEESGSLTSPVVLGAFLESLEARLPRGAADVRDAWEQAGERRSDDGEAFLRDVASRSGAASLGARVAEIVASRLSGEDFRRASSPAVSRRTWLAGDVAAAAPAPLGWRRVSLNTEEERAGLEIGFPETGARAARMLLFYRGEGGFDSLPAFAGATRVIPAAGTSRVQVVLADGDGAAEEPLRVRRVPDYPAALASASAGWASGGVEIAWETSRHEDLLGWVVERRDEADADPTALVRDTLPATSDAESATGYLWVDRDAVPGHRYRYRVLALTEDGLLGEAFEATVAGR